MARRTDAHPPQVHLPISIDDVRFTFFKTPVEVGAKAKALCRAAKITRKDIERNIIDACAMYSIDAECIFDASDMEDVDVILRTAGILVTEGSPAGDVDPDHLRRVAEFKKLTRQYRDCLDAIVALDAIARNMNEGTRTNIPGNLVSLTLEDLVRLGF